MSCDEVPHNYFALVLAADEYEVIESYKEEIEKFCQRINDLVIAKVVKSSQNFVLIAQLLFKLELSPIELTIVESQLNMWFSETVDYLRRSILMLEPVLSDVLHNVSASIV